MCRSRSEEGGAIVEFALTFLVFISLVFAIIDFGHLFFVEMAVQNALQEAARYGSTGLHMPNPKSPGNYYSRVQSIQNTLTNDAMGAQISSIQVTNVPITNPSATPSTNGGGYGDLLTVSATVNMPLITPMAARLFPNGIYTFTLSTTIMNEPFPPSQNN
jgi:Flp pilus assembly protein TadG